jgi:murein DD-endopeptidase MepM/ murein hydrolase activator NlpD
MMPKYFKRSSSRFVFLAGLVLCVFCVLEIGQQMVEAFDLGNASPTAHSTANPTANPTVPSSPAELPIATIPTGQLSFPAAPKSATLPSVLPQRKLQAAKPERQTLAINSGDLDPGQQPIAQNIEAIRLAATNNEWMGASFPVEDFQEYTSPFGYRLSPYGGYTQEFHYGLDMASPEGSYIRNWWAGKVVEVSDNSNCGTSVVLESGPWTHIYCHMQGHVEQTANGLAVVDREGGVQILAGQDLPAGARIGRVGMTGRTTGPHLHWGLKYDGNWVDPALVLRAMYSSQQASAAGNNPAQ